MESKDGRFLDIVNEAVENLRTSLQERYAQEKQSWDQERQDLLNKIKGLETTVELYEDFKHENEKLRQLLKHETAGDVEAADGLHKDVSYQHFKRVISRCHELAQLHENAKRQGGEFEKAMKRFREAYQEGKIATKEWRKYAISVRDNPNVTVPTVPGLSRFESFESVSSASPAALTASARTSFRFGLDGKASACPPTSEHQSSEEAQRGHDIGAAAVAEAAKDMLNARSTSLTPHDLDSNVSHKICDEHTGARIFSYQQTATSVLHIPRASDKRSVEHSTEQQAQSTEAEQPATQPKTTNVNGNGNELPSSQTTEDGEALPADTNTSHEPHDSNSEPLVIFERPVKKRRANAATERPVQHAIRASGTNYDPISIKDEQGSSPIGLAAIPLAVHAESYDLNEIQGSVTPKKRDRGIRKLAQANANMVSIGTDPDLVRSQSVPVEAMKKRTMRTSSEQVQAENTQSVRLEVRDSQERDEECLLEMESPFFKPAATADGSARKPQALQLLDKNRKRDYSWLTSGPLKKIPNTRDRRTRKPSPGKTVTVEATPAIESTVIEEEAEYAPHKPALPTPTHSKTSSMSEEAKRATSTVKSPVTALVTPDTAKRPPIHTTSAKTKPSAKGPSKYNTPTTRSATKKPSTADNGKQPAPLRSKPVAELTLEDFKINPSANDGLTYAYNEPVRNKTAKRCLAGCTRPDCCGDTFRKLVNIAGPLPPRPPPLWDTTPRAADPAIAEEQRLLEDYLGHDSGRLRELSADERAELVNKAQAERFAKEHGRHRVQWQRSRTPPGFWSTDMPSTQDLEAQKVENQRAEREAVEQRRREALRGTGRWLFKDE